MMTQRILTLMTLLLTLTACSNQARLDYYAAVQASAEAQARESEARYNALSSMARGDGEASVAAVMAIALAQKPTIQPQYIEDDALKWASILAGPVAAVASLAIQADLSRDLNDSNQKIAIARINADAATDQNLHSALTQPTTPGLDAAGLGVVVDGLVDLGTSGLAGVEGVAVAGLGTTEAVAGHGLDTAETLSLHGMDSLLQSQTTGYQTIEQIVASEHHNLDNVLEHFKGLCLTCEEVGITVTPPEPEPCDDELVISPAVCVP